jgi:hypothetical protein
MATRSRIGIINPDQTISSIYCHWDGLPDTMHYTLNTHYNSQDGAQSLVDMGDASYIHATVAESKFYHRDSGEDLCIDVAPSLESYLELAESSGGQWAYLWNGQLWSYYKI